MLVIVAVAVTDLPSEVAAKCLMDISIPTEDDPLNPLEMVSALHAASSISATMAGVA
jgi:hypothetical protein